MFALHRGQGVSVKQRDPRFGNFFGHTHHASTPVLPSPALQTTGASRRALFPGSRRHCDGFHRRLLWLVGTALARCRFASTGCAGSWPLARGSARQRRLCRPWHHSATAARWLGCRAAVTRSYRPLAENSAPVVVAAALGFPPSEG